jgi:choline dehydrogenase-like flavoprotein
METPMKADAPDHATLPPAEDAVREQLLSDARSPKNSSFDYIIVGSGAGGGPLASRLALAGKKVLVIEAGTDPLQAKSKGYPNAGPGEVTKVPGYYAAASEDAEMSWMYSVRHHEDGATQAKDDKYNRVPLDPNRDLEKEPEKKLDPKYLDPHPRKGQPGFSGGLQGIFYPRSSGIGGCTAHHAMITICPNDKDWNYIANLTGDASWRAGAMRGYFAKFERNQYLAAYDRFFGRLLGIFYKIYRSAVLLIDPRAVLDDGGHGFKGWAPTNLIDPFLVTTIAQKDRPFIKAIIGAALGVLHGNNALIAFLKSQLLKLRVVQAIDFNDINTRRVNPEGVFLIPLGIEGGAEATDDEGQPGKGRRFGVREFLLKTRFRHPDRLVIRSGAHVTRVLFEQGPSGEAPRAIGVECAVGEHLYEASPLQKNESKERVCYFAKQHRGEIVLCGGAFNTPQLLMLSGIGDEAHLANTGITHLHGAKANAEGVWQAEPQPTWPAIDLPGVGGNLQDRYEVTVVSELDKDFATLEGVSFDPGDKQDPARRQWFDDKTGLYATNGGTLAVIRRSKPATDAGEAEPDLFTFGAPAAFRGYYWNWSRELFKETIGATEKKHRLWSWVILKAYTSNHDGTVRLRTSNPFDMPEICFDAFNEKAEKERPEIAARRKRTTAECDALAWAGRAVPIELQEQKKQAEADWAENESKLVHSKRDLAALMDAVSFMRKVNGRNAKQFIREIQPGTEIADDSSKMEDWVRTQAWGHHCSCTCRIGSDKWQADTGKLLDREAVLDSRFKVHGVQGLRIVDASVFPKIPGYFILAPIFMISEKAADTLIEDSVSQVYPARFEAAEAAAIRARRVKAGRPADSAGGRKPELERLPDQTVGLALSGGGIRSSTFALGVLQALAARNRLREVDILSTVSGGGFIGSFVGRLFTRETVKLASDPCARVQETLKNSSSAPLHWLRTQANYILATGSSDLRLNLAVLWRNIFAVYLVIGALLFSFFGLLAWLPDAVTVWAPRWGAFQLPTLLRPLLTGPTVRGIELSSWWWLPLLALALGLLPATLGYWLAPKIGSYRPYPFFSLLAWLVLLTGALLALGIPHGTLYAGGLALVLILAWFWQEAARWGAIQGKETDVERQKVGAIVRNRIVRSLGEVMFIFFGLVAWVALDTFALLFAKAGWTMGLSVATAALAPLLPLLQKVAMSAKQEMAPGGQRGFSLQRVATTLGIPLAIFFLLVIDVHAHRLFILYPGWGWGLFISGVTAAFSLAIGRAFDFLNLSSLQATYAARLVRTFQGASNEERVYASTSSEGHDVGVAHPQDDIPWHEYHPERHGGPLHFVNVTINETVDAASEREIRERKSLPMCITPHGVSVGRRYFARWARPDSLPHWQRFRRWLAGVDGGDSMPFLPWPRKPANANPPALTALEALPVSSNPNDFHVLKTKESESAEVESLSLGEWIGISGAAFSTGIGRATNLPLSLFMGLANVRLGYWWDSGIRNEERPGRYPQSLWRRLKRLPVTLFRAQSMLLAEWRARFHGPSRWFWYLSDGGHFEVTGLYEMLRRRLRFMIVSDAGEDPNYQWNDISLLTQQVREDFDAEIVWLTRQAAAGGARMNGWGAFPLPTLPPLWIQQWIDPDTLGSLNDIRRKGAFHAALARVTYFGSDDVSWILLFKPGLDNDLTQDLLNYGDVNTAFPQTPTFDQFFDDIQWESYRALGQQIAGRVLR